MVVTHSSTSTNPAEHGRESDSQPVGHKYDALTTTLPSHVVYQKLAPVFYSVQV